MGRLEPEKEMSAACGCPADPPSPAGSVTAGGTSKPLNEPAAEGSGCCGSPPLEALTPDSTPWQAEKNAFRPLGTILPMAEPDDDGAAPEE